MKQLQVLDRSQNNFSGTLDECFGNLTSLLFLDLSFNYLRGNPSPVIAHLSTIGQLSIAGNQFEGIFPFNIFANHSKLKGLAIGYMNSKFQIETENPPWVAPFQLEVLEMSSCDINLPSKGIPTFLFNQTSLTIIILSRNKLVGKFPSWLLTNNPSLTEVYLGENSFTGTFELPLDLNYFTTEITYLDISNNQIQGKLPGNIGSFFPHLLHLDVSNNMFDGHIPASIGDLSSLIVLVLENNSFSGEVPEHVIDGCISLKTLVMDNNKLNGTLVSLITKHRLSTLIASRNNFEGTITDEWCQNEGLPRLDLSYNKFSGALPSCIKMREFLFLQGNNFTGTIPEALISSDSRPLMAIDLSDNKFTETIPDSLYMLGSLQFLSLAGNQLHGQISSQICQLKKIDILDFSRNNFNGSIPSCFNSMSFANASLDVDTSTRAEYNHLPFYGEMQLKTKGNDYSYTIHRYQDMSLLDLSCNELTGEIPLQIGALHSLRSLNLSHNHLIRKIPVSFHMLDSIESLDLSNNNLNGQIPFQLQELHFLSTFNVSYNNLSERAPDQKQFATFDENNYKEILILLGVTVIDAIQYHSDRQLYGTMMEKKKNIQLISLPSWSFVASYVTVLIVLVTILWINPHWRECGFILS